VDPRIKNVLQLEENQPWVLVATSGPGHSISLAHHQRVIESVMRLSGEMPDIRFVAKLHPKDQLAHYEAARLKVPGSRLILFSQKSRSASQDIFDWLQGCPLLITGGSTSGIDALLMNVPVVSVDFADELENYDFIESGSTLHARSEEQLRVSIRRVFDDPLSLADTRVNANQFIQSSFFDLDGNPVKNAAMIIAQFASTGDTSPLGDQLVQTDRNLTKAN
jgi:hypothetical protein